MQISTKWIKEIRQFNNVTLTHMISTNDAISENEES